MMGFLMRMFGKRVVHQAVAKQRNGGLLDIKFGFSLLRNRRVPMRYKLLALGLGAALTAGLVALELPVESILAALVIGLPFDAALDGLETMVGPVLFGVLLLPHLAPRGLVEQIRLERSGPVVDVESQETKPEQQMRYAR